MNSTWICILCQWGPYVSLVSHEIFTVFVKQNKIFLLEIIKCFSKFVVKVSFKFRWILDQKEELPRSGTNSVKILLSPYIIPVGVNWCSLKTCLSNIKKLTYKINMQRFCNKNTMANRNRHHSIFEVISKSSYILCAITMSIKLHCN